MLRSEKEKFLNNFLDVQNYSETFETNLNKDKELQQFWSNLLPSLIDKFALQAAESEKTETSQNRAELYRNEYTEHVNQLMQNKEDFCSVRMLLELNEVFLTKNGFVDVWSSQKKNENDQALKLLNARLNQIDSIYDFKKRWEEIIRGLLAGNIFDSGATAVQELLLDNKNFGLEEALQKIPERPWLIDSFDDFMFRIKNNPPHNCCVIFCDNSGVDCILGILPFARELLKNNTKVILSANFGASLNDVTHNELVKIIETATSICPILKKKYQSKSLLLKSSGSNGCCLNFLNLDEALLELMEENQADLIVIEGMGRSLHTNLNSKFKIDVFKLAVIKNKFLASRLGGDLFDAICKFETSSITC